MAKKKYSTPLFITVGADIGLTDSQEGTWGGGSTDYPSFNEWWNSDDVQSNIDMIYPGFSISDSSTWPEGFDPNDPYTYELLFAW